MTPGGRISAAIEILDEIIAGSPAERALTRWSRASRFAGSKDRAAIRDHIFDVLRKRRSCLWLSGQEVETGRALMIGLLVEGGTGAEAEFSGEGHAPARLSADEVAAIRHDLSAAPLPVRADLPPVMEDILLDELGPDCERAMTALRDRAPVDVRVNTLKADRATAARLLAVESIDVVPIEAVATGLRVRGNARKLTQSRAYSYGFAELQDAASQLVSLRAAAAPGETVLDLCAGGGGKTLALGACMNGQGMIAAYDINPRRMQDLPKRASRAGLEVSIVDDAFLDSAAGRFDLVLVDAPCSGTGAWRRDPDNKWRMTPERHATLMRTQDDVLDRAAQLVKAGGRIVYSTCSILQSENRARIDAFLARHDRFALDSDSALMPGEIGDGFYVARLNSSIR